MGWRREVDRDAALDDLAPRLGELAVAAGLGGEIELAPPQYVTLLDLRETATVAEAIQTLKVSEELLEALRKIRPQG